jgi:hypothetical protein
MRDSFIGNCNHVLARNFGEKVTEPKTISHFIACYKMNSHGWTNVVFLIENAMFCYSLYIDLQR